MKCDLDLGTSHTVLAQCKPSNDGEHLCKDTGFLQLMKELWSGQAVVSHLTLNCDLDLGLRQMALCTALHIMAMHMYTKFKVILPEKGKVMLQANGCPPTMGDSKICLVFDRCIKTG